MTHYSRLSKIVIDVPPAEHDREVAFWSAAAGQELTQGVRYPEYHGAALHGGEFGCSSSGSAAARAGFTWTFTPTTWTPRSPGWKH
jgi:hypothetical protein